MTQRAGLWGTQTFTLLEDKLVVRGRSFGRSSEQAVPYIHLAPDPMRVRQIGFVRLGIAAAGFLTAAAMIYFAWQAARRDTATYSRSPSSAVRPA